MTRAVVCLLLLTCPVTANEKLTPQFRLTYDKTITTKPFTGRVFVMLSQRAKEPRTRLSPIRPDPVFAKDVKNWKAGETITLSGEDLTYPRKFPELNSGSWNVQAVMDLDQGYRKFSTAPGNGYSRTKKVDLDKTRTVKLHLDQIVKPTPFPETDRVKLVDIPSKLLSDFHKRVVRLQAGVILPKSFKSNPKKRYPVIYEIPGFSGTHFGALRAAKRNPTNVDGVEALYVVLNPSSRWGHHVFADSANNGPCGEALIKELIPYLEKKYRAIGNPGSRIVTGHSSGGWSSLWLQVTYPSFFGGVWSTSPDSVDFRAFQDSNIYTEKNIFFRDGKPIPLVRRGRTVMLSFRPYSDMDTIMGHGGQLGSFEAVFGPRGKDGRPVPLWDRKTGAINPKIAQAWKKYDIRLILEQNWKRLAPLLKGKIHVYMGGMDTYHLDGATRLLKRSLENLESDAVVEIFPGRSHNLLDKSIRARIAREMADQFKKNRVAGSR